MLFGLESIGTTEIIVILAVLMLAFPVLIVVLVVVNASKKRKLIVPPKELADAMRNLAGIEDFEVFPSIVKS